MSDKLIKRLSPCNMFLLEQQVVPSLVQKYPTSCGNERTLLLSLLHVTCLWRLHKYFRHITFKIDYLKYKMKLWSPPRPVSSRPVYTCNIALHSLLSLSQVNRYSTYFATAYHKISSPRDFKPERNLFKI